MTVSPSLSQYNCFIYFSTWLTFFLAEGVLFGFGDNKMSQLGQGHQKPVMPKPVQVRVKEIFDDTTAVRRHSCEDVQVCVFGGYTLLCHTCKRRN